MKLTIREMMLAMVTVMVLLFGGTWVWFWMPMYTDWKASHDEMTQNRFRIEKAERTLSRKEDLDQRLNALREKLPKFEMDQEVTAEFLRELERTAQKYGLSLTRTTPSDEEPVGDLYEMSVNCSWQASLEGLVEFLFDLQSRGGNIDVESINASPDSKRRDLLKGSFIIRFAYSRTE